MMGEPPVARGNLVCLMMYSLQSKSVRLDSEDSLGKVPVSVTEFAILFDQKDIKCCAMVGTRSSSCF